MTYKIEIKILSSSEYGFLSLDNDIPGLTSRIRNAVALPTLTVAKSTVDYLIAFSPMQMRSLLNKGKDFETSVSITVLDIKDGSITPTRSFQKLYTFHEQA